MASAPLWLFSGAAWKEPPELNSDLEARIRWGLTSVCWVSLASSAHLSMETGCFGSSEKHSHYHRAPACCVLIMCWARQCAFLPSHCTTGPLHLLPAVLLSGHPHLLWVPAQISSSSEALPDHHVSRCTLHLLSPLHHQAPFIFSPGCISNLYCTNHICLF